MKNKEDKLGLGISNARGHHIRERVILGHIDPEHSIDSRENTSRSISLTNRRNQTEINLLAHLNQGYENEKDAREPKQFSFSPPKKDIQIQDTGVVK